MARKCAPTAILLAPERAAWEAHWTMAKRAAADPSSPLSAILYTRVSTPQQGRVGISLDAQLAACRAFAESRGWSVLSSHSDDGLSGKLPPERRPGLGGVIADSRRHPGAAIVVYSLSRLGRSQRLIWELLDERGPYRLLVSSVTEPFDTTTPMGRAFLGMLATFAQLESDLASERTVAALAHAKAQGRKLGGPTMLESCVPDPGRRPAYPGHVPQVLAPDPAKVAIAEMAFELRASGLSIRNVAARLNAAGAPSATGRKWHPTSVARLLRCELPSAP
jgi:site-specific DNA recombinase